MFSGQQHLLFRNRTVNSCLYSNFSFFERKVTKEANQLRQLDRLLNGRRITQSPMKLRFRCCHRWLRSSVLCGSLRACRRLPHAADKAPFPPSAIFPHFTGLLRRSCRCNKTGNFCLYDSTFSLFERKSCKKKQTTLGRLTAYANAGHYHAKPDEAPYTAFIGSLLECISRPSLRFAGVRWRRIGFPHSIILPLVHLLADSMLVFLRKLSAKQKFI